MGRPARWAGWGRCGGALRRAGADSRRALGRPGTAGGGAGGRAPREAGTRLGDPVRRAGAGRCWGAVRGSSADWCWGAVRGSSADWCWGPVRHAGPGSRRALGRPGTAGGGAGGRAPREAGTRLGDPVRRAGAGRCWGALWRAAPGAQRPRGRSGSVGRGIGGPAPLGTAARMGGAARRARPGLAGLTASSGAAGILRGPAGAEGAVAAAVGGGPRSTVRRGPVEPPGGEPAGAFLQRPVLIRLVGRSAGAGDAGHDCGQRGLGASADRVPRPARRLSGCDRQRFPSLPRPRGRQTAPFRRVAGHCSDDRHRPGRGSGPGLVVPEEAVGTHRLGGPRRRGGRGHSGCRDLGSHGEERLGCFHSFIRLVHRVVLHAAHGGRDCAPGPGAEEAPRRSRGLPARSGRSGAVGADGRGEPLVPARRDQPVPGGDDEPLPVGGADPRQCHPDRCAGRPIAARCGGAAHTAGAGTTAPAPASVLRSSGRARCRIAGRAPPASAGPAASRRRRDAGGERRNRSGRASSGVREGR
ncbi:hypothetical protein HMPREF9005_0529 [Actinomyces sp. oral taxon 178 str. F0338]|nr:hypothetical protein HMPREF9005_0529 [Actinomyces sp. oral taxon 178 str. F0338]